MNMQSHFSSTPLAANGYELPSWAVAAAGESRLEVSSSRPPWLALVSISVDFSVI